MNVAIFTPALVDGDGVGNDVLGMASVLRRAGHTVVFSTRFASTFPTVPLNRLGEVLTGPDDVLIYHHSIGCEEGVQQFETLPCRKVVKYHNVTPAHYFEQLEPRLAQGCRQGMREAARLLRLGVPVWVDSPFNGRELEALRPGADCAVLPPFNQVDQLLAAEPDRTSVGLYDDWLTNILVVGRLAPNKNIVRALEAFASYLRRHDGAARLILVGDLFHSTYCNLLLDRIKELRLGAHVFITGKVFLGQLKALFLTSQVLLTTSSHEGFCLPLVEAMGLRVPIVAVPGTAIPDTGGDVPLYAEDDAEQLADALAAVQADPLALEERLDRGWRRYAEHFDNRTIGKRFLRLFEGAACAATTSAVAI